MKSIKFILVVLSIALGWEIRADIRRGYPCIRRLNQLYCPTPGNKYPNANTTQGNGGGRTKREQRMKSERIDKFIDENKSLVKRMFGEYEKFPEGAHTSPFSTYDGHKIYTRSQRIPRSTYGASPNKWIIIFRVDACESTVEIVTPYWASNSAGKIRAIINTKHLQQAIQQEVCQSQQTKRCHGDCSCEQKYKWHRLLAYDPDDDCRGIFMDWFLFPSCCVCRCTILVNK
ncbi:protein spaetzle 3-like isoform X1 [Tachypleus tridentatus]|uniref:protein spaetzle 3-like isoform X1 n=1 Tax=Tachypleus tridentatus TaxID=6853 RepID=UPI003FD16CF7